MTRLALVAASLAATVATGIGGGQPAPTFLVVNMIPKSLSPETNQDSEPNLAVNPKNPLLIAGSAFTPNPLGGNTAPIFASQDGGATWFMNNIVPSQRMTGDITLRFGTDTDVLYAGILRMPFDFRMSILRTSNFLGGGTMKILAERNGIDQPYIQAVTVNGKDRVFVGNNAFKDPGVTAGHTATLDVSQDAVADPAAFAVVRLDTRAGTQFDGPQIRPAFAPDGKRVYAAFLRWTSGTNGETFTKFKFDLVVVRDDNGGMASVGAPPFRTLTDPADGQPGVRVVAGRDMVFFKDKPAFGQERVGGDPAVAVNPANPDEVYVAWTDLQPFGAGGGNHLILHLRRSGDGGKTWSANDLRTIDRAKNPAIAVTTKGVVGLVYQRFEDERWKTVFERSTDRFATLTPFTLADTPGYTPAATFLPYLGDYLHMMAAGKDFYGVFSASNAPVKANFPQGVKFQRNANFDANKLLSNDGVTPVAVSIDPYFFKVTEPE